MSIENAIAVESIAAERAYLAAHPCACGGAWKVSQQALVFDEARKPHDQLRATCQGCGDTGEFWFDVSAFFGRPPG